jgi:hypothetical protein
MGNPRSRDEFINPGPLSSAHSLRSFAAIHGQTNSFTCGSCHDAGNVGPPGIINAALAASPAPWQWTALLKTNTGAASRMDGACEKCHLAHDFHQPNVSRDVGCAWCHEEHQGAGRMARVTDQQCGICHGKSAVMAAARTKGSEMPAKSFASPRPKEGFTEVIHSFSRDHPEFRAIRTGTRDPDTLRFNHRLHLTSPTIPQLPSHQKLDCAFCHQPDASGAFIRRVDFERNCRVCHSLQFDPETSNLQLPHGDPKFVSAFLHSLPQQYSDYARRIGITDASDRRRIVESKLAALRAQLQPGEDLESRVFFSTASAGPAARSATVEGASRPMFVGCAYCHEVKRSSTEVAVITKPVLAERWLLHSQFQHGKHTGIACADCHGAAHSSQTSDVLLPSRTECVHCHSPSGGAPNSCVTCHSYHNHRQFSIAEY